MTKLDKAFQKLLSQISDKLSLGDVKSIKCHLEFGDSKIPKQDLDAAEHGEEVFSLMKKHGLLSKTNTDELLEILRTKKLAQCIQLVENFNKENEKELTLAKEGPCNITEDMIVEHFMETSKLKELEDKLTEKKFVMLSGLLGSGKSQLAIKCACLFREKCKDGVCWRISCQDEVFLINSLKKLADQLDLKEQSKQSEEILYEESLGNILDLIMRELKISDSSIQHFLIFDDVRDKTRHWAEKMKKMFLKLNNVKIIATAWDASFCDEENVVYVNGFSLEEAVRFLKKKPNLSSEEEQSYIELAKHLSCLPLAMYAVRTRMISHKLTPKGFIKFLKGRNSLPMIDRFLSSAEDKKLYEVLVQFLDILKKDVADEVFDMILILQFLSLEDIPILLFKFLPTGNDEKDEGLKESFIEAIQKFSFGQLRGEDDERFISTHLAVAKTIDFYTLSEEKARLIKKVLTALVWLLDKDNIHEKDYKRNSDLLPHAISVIRHYESLKAKMPVLCNDFEMNILLAYVCDLVGYIYNFFGMLKNAGEYWALAKECCFKLIGLSEVRIEDMVKQTCTRDEGYKSWEQFAKHEAQLIFESLQKQASDPAHQEMLQKFSLDFVLNKYRGQEHIELLQGYLGNDLQEEYTLTKSEYYQLCQNNLAVPVENHLGEMFLYELILQVFYTFGRRIFYLGTAVDKEIARKFSHSLFLARELGVLIAEESAKWNYPKLLYIMLAELSGTLEQVFDDRAKLQLKTLENIENAAERVKELQESEASYFIWGIIKSGFDSFHHRKICYKRLVHCYTVMAECTTDKEKLKEIEGKGQLCNEKLNELSKQWGYRQTGADLRMGRFSLVLKDYPEAELMFKKVAPADMFGDSVDDVRQSILNFHQFLALKGLIECYVKWNKNDEAKQLADRLKARLEATNELEELAHVSEMLVQLGIGQ